MADVRLLDGGLAAWTAAGLELSTRATGGARRGDVVLSSGHLPVLTADEAGDLARDGVLLDARAAERYRGEVGPVGDCVAGRGEVPVRRESRVGVDRSSTRSSS